MTIKELKDFLDTVEDENIRVVVNGYEGGYCDVCKPGVIDLALNVNGEWWYGPHEEANGFEVEEWHEVVKALVI